MSLIGKSFEVFRCNLHLVHGAGKNAQKGRYRFIKLIRHILNDPLALCFGALHGRFLIGKLLAIFFKKVVFKIFNRPRYDAGFIATPYHALVPSFGEWGFVLAGRRAYRAPAGYPVETSFLTVEVTPTLFQFPKDMARVDAEVNRLNNQVLVRYFEHEWRQVIR